MPDSIEETPARAGAQLPVGDPAQATNDVRDRTVLIGVFVVIAIIAAVWWFAAH